jgi:hypothetical protein
MSAIAPAMSSPEGSCASGFLSVFIEAHPADHNGNNIVCQKELPNGNTLTIDDIVIPIHPGGGPPR